MHIQHSVDQIVQTTLAAVFFSMELSRSKWLVTYLAPGAGERMSKHVLVAGDVAGLSSIGSRGCYTARILAEQQVRFDQFRSHYNEERPHEALGQVPPASLWKPSSRQMPDRVEDPWYDADHEVRRVQQSGDIKWRQSRVFVSESLYGELVGVIEREDGSHLVRFCDIDLGVIDGDGRFRRFAPRRHRLRDAPVPPDQNCGGSTRSNL